MPLLHTTLEILKQAWADTQQKECICLIGMDALGTSEHEKRKSLLLIIINKY